MEMLKQSDFRFSFFLDCFPLVQVTGNSTCLDLCKKKCEILVKNRDFRQFYGGNQHLKNQQSFLKNVAVHRRSRGRIWTIGELYFGWKTPVTIVPQEEANIEKKTKTMTIVYINRLDISRNFGCCISNLGRFTIVTNDVFPHWLSPAERGHWTDINSSS